MTGITRNFLLTAVAYGILGIIMGLGMAISEDHSQRPTHAHVMVIGWLSFFAFAIFYHLFRQGVSALLSKLHFWLSQASMACMVVGLWLVYGGNEGAVPIAAGSAIVYGVSFLIFAVVVFQAVSAAGRE